MAFRTVDFTLSDATAEMTLFGQQIQMREPENNSSATQPVVIISKSKRKRMRQQKKKAEEREKKAKEEEETRMDWESVSDDEVVEKKKKKKKKATTDIAPETFNATVPSTSGPLQAVPPFVSSMFFNPAPVGVVCNPPPVVTPITNVGSGSPLGPVQVAQLVCPVYFNMPVEMGAVASRAGSSSVVYPPEHVSDPAPSTSASSPVRHEGLMITPRVSWKTQPLPNVEYRGCAIFDTCALINNPRMLEEAIRLKFLAVVPFTVLKESDHKNKTEPRLRKNIKKFMNTIKNTRCNLINTYLRMEGNWERRTEVPEYYEGPEPKNDDFILKCAVRTKAELLSLEWELGIYEDRIIFVTDDGNLLGKARSARIRFMEGQQFIESFLAPVIVEEPPRHPIPPPMPYQRKLPVVANSSQRSTRPSPISRPVTSQSSSTQQRKPSSQPSPPFSVNPSNIPKSSIPAHQSTVDAELASYEDFMS